MPTLYTLDTLYIWHIVYFWWFLWEKKRLYCTLIIADLRHCHTSDILRQCVCVCLLSHFVIFFWSLFTICLFTFWIFFPGVKWHPDEHGVIGFDCRNRKWWASKYLTNCHFVCKESIFIFLPCYCNTQGFKECNKTPYHRYIQAATSPKDVVILVDVSGSMKGLRLTIARQTVSSILDTLGDDDFFNIIAVGFSSTKMSPFSLCLYIFVSFLIIWLHLSKYYYSLISPLLSEILIT